MLSFGNAADGYWIPELIIGASDRHTTSKYPTLEQVHDWRVRSAHLLSLLETPDQKTRAVVWVASTMLDVLSYVMTGKPIDTRSLNDDALEIVRKAAELDKIFKMSKADFHVFITRVKVPLVNPPRFGFRFDPETMKVAETFPMLDYQKTGGQNMMVDLAISPGVLKAGNFDGENYESERVLVKLEALCDLQAILGHCREPQETMESDHSQQDSMDEETVRVKEEESYADNDVDMIVPM